MLRTGVNAPAFKLATTSGEALSLQLALENRPVLLAFFKVSCPTCQYTFPFLERIHQQLRGEGTQVWGVAQDNAQHAGQFAKTFGVTFPILIDDSPYKVSRLYGLAHVPSIFLIGQDHHIELTSEGFCKSDLLAMQKTLLQPHSIAPAALFLQSERVPEFKPG